MGAQYFITIANCVVNLPLAFVAVTGNALFLYGVWKTPSLRSPFILLLCGLASTDLSVGLIAQPVFITEVLVGLYSRSENLTLAFTKAHQMIARSLCGVSLLMIGGISIDRFIAIVKPLHYPSTVTSIRVTRFVVASWALSVLAQSAEFWGPRLAFAVSSLYILTCLSSSITCHTTMYKILRRHRLQIHTHVQAINDSNTRTAMARLGRSAFNTFVVFIVLLICYFPYLAVYIVHFTGKAGDLKLWMQLSATVVFLNSALNPFLYCWRIREIRVATLRTFRRLVSREWFTKYCHSPLRGAFLFFLFVPNKGDDESKKTTFAINLKIMGKIVFPI